MLCFMDGMFSVYKLNKPLKNKYTDRSPNLFVHNTIEGRVGILVIRKPLLVDNPHFS